MSLINQVLKDLEQRHRPERDLILPQAVSGMNSRSLIRWPWFVAGFTGLLFLGLVIGFFWFHHYRRPVPIAALKPVPLEKNATVLHAMNVPHSSKNIQAPIRVSALNEIHHLKLHKSLPLIADLPKQLPKKIHKKRRSPKIIPQKIVSGNMPVAPKSPPTSIAGSADVLSLIHPADIHEQSQTQYQLGIKMLESGRIPDALAAFQQAITLDMKNDPARQALAQIYMEQHQFLAAESLLKSGLSIQPGLLAFSFPLARILVQQGDDAKALEVLNEAQQQGVKNADYLALRAAILTRLARPVDAIADYRQALLLKPGEASWLVGLGIAFEANHDQLDARTAYLEARATQHLSIVLEDFVQHRLLVLSGG